MSGADTATINAGAMRQAPGSQLASAQQPLSQASSAGGGDAP